MSKFCTNCGSSIDDDAKFCEHCGSRVEDVYAAQTTQNSQQSTVNKQPNTPAAHSAPKRKNAWLAPTALFMAIVIIGNILMFTVIKEQFTGKGTNETVENNVVGENAESGEAVVTENVFYTESEIAAAPAKTANVSRDAHEVVLDDVTVNFSPLNIDEESTFTLRKLPEKVDSGDGSTFDMWDFDLGDKHEFDFPVEVTVPYGDVEEPYQTITAHHYDEKTGEWDDIPYSIDESEKTVTFWMTEFSSGGIKKRPSPVQSYKRMTEGEKAYQDVGGMSSDEINAKNRYIKINLLSENLIHSFSSTMTDDGLKDILNKNYGEDTIKALKSASDKCGIVAEYGGNSLSLADLAIRGSKIAETASPAMAKTLGYLSTAGKIFGVVGVATASIGWAETAMKTNSATDTFKKHFDEIGAAALTIGDAVGLIEVHPAVMLSIAAFSFAKGKVTALSNNVLYNGKENAVEDVYYQFTHDGRIYWIPKKESFDYKLTKEDYANIVSKSTAKSKKFAEIKSEDTPAGGIVVSLDDPTAFVSIMKVIENKYPDKPEIWLDTFEYTINKMAEYFWTLPEEQRSAMIQGLSNEYNPKTSVNSSMRDSYIKDMKNSIIAELNEKYDFYRVYTAKIIGKVKEKARDDVEKLQDNMNRIIKFELDLKDKKGKSLTLSNSEYKDYYIIFDPEGNNLNLIKPWELNKNSTTVFDCTYASYLAAGEPKQILIYKSEEDYLNKEKTLRTIEIPEIEDKQTTIVLKMDSDKKKVESASYNLSPKAVTGDHTYLMVGDGKASELYGSNTLTISQDGSFTISVPSSNPYKVDSNNQVAGTTGFFKMGAFSVSGKLISVDSSGNPTNHGFQGGVAFRDENGKLYTYKADPDSIHFSPSSMQASTGVTYSDEKGNSYARPHRFDIESASFSLDYNEYSETATVKAAVKGKFVSLPDGLHDWETSEDCSVAVSYDLESPYVADFGYSAYKKNADGSDKGDEDDGIDWENL